MSNLHVDSIMKSYHGHRILQDIYVACEKGEIVGLLGRNGTGKSTLLKIIFGSIPSESRFVRVGTKVTSGLFDNRNLINYLPQHGFLPSHIKIKNLINIFCGKHKEELLDKHDFVKPLLNKKSNYLSGGELRFLEILLVIYSEAEFVLIDEPFNGISPVVKEDIKALIRNKASDKGFIVTDHDYDNVLDLATRVIMMHEGGTKQIKEREELVYWGYLNQ